jgi:FkbM family methyltransferase
MKKAAIRILGPLVPDRVWNFMLKAMLQNDDILQRHGHRYLSQIASKLNISRVSARGDYGTFSSAPNDEMILRDYAKNGKWAATTNDAIAKFFSDGSGTYIDIGANIGLTVVPLATTSNVRCYAFEPEPTNFENLKINIIENCASKDIRVFQLAIFDRQSSIAFEMSPSNLGDHRIRLNGASAGYLNEDKRRVIEVPCVRLDDLKLEIEGPLFVKIDTQGAEPFVIEGGKETLARADALLMEWSPYLMKRMGGDGSLAINFLRDNFNAGAIHHNPEAAHSESEFQSIDLVCNVLRDSLVEWPASKYADVMVLRNTRQLSNA